MAAGRRLGKKALVLGAIAQSIPDIDIVASPWLSATDDLLAHRGITHSILFAFLASVFLGWLSSRVFKNTGMTFRQWAIFWGLGIFVHIFIDAFNTYGTGWFEPFSHYRVCFNVLYVADPLFTIVPVISFIALLLLRTSSIKRMVWGKSAILASTLYLSLALLVKQKINRFVSNSFSTDTINTQRYFTSPTPLNTLLWYVVKETDSGFYIGYRSVFDSKGTIDYHFAPRNEYLLQRCNNAHDISNLIRFSQGYYTASLRRDTVLFNDIRFGEIQGWAEPQPEFIFYYYPQYPDANKLAVQRGRFAKWNGNTLKRYISRIAGN